MGCGFVLLTVVEQVLVLEVYWKILVISYFLDYIILSFSYRQSAGNTGIPRSLGVVLGSTRGSTGRECRV